MRPYSHDLDRDKTLSELLLELGFTHKRINETSYRHAIFNGAGKVVFEGPAWRVWEWVGDNKHLSV